MINIATLLSDDTNIIEIYLLSSNSSTDDSKLNININDDFLDKIKRKFKLTKETTLVSFNRNNLSYVMI